MVAESRRLKTLRASSLVVYEWGKQGDPAVLYWDGLGGTGLHANELAPILVADHGLRVVAPDAPGHGRSPASPADVYRPSRLAEAAARLLDELGIERVHFVGFSQAFFAYERESLRRWTPAVAEAHEAVMREQDGRVVPIVDAETLGAIQYGNRLEPVTETYAVIAGAGVSVLLLYASSSTREEPVALFKAFLPNARVAAIPDAIHDLVSFAPDEMANAVGIFIASSR